VPPFASFVSFLPLTPTPVTFLQSSSGSPSSVSWSGAALMVGKFFLFAILLTPCSTRLGSLTLLLQALKVTPAT
jgi:hypothetical protein